jgi:hypothetical protein
VAHAWRRHLLPSPRHPRPLCPLSRTCTGASRTQLLSASCNARHPVLIPHVIARTSVLYSLFNRSAHNGRSNGHDGSLTPAPGV